MKISLQDEKKREREREERDGGRSRGREKKRERGREIGGREGEGGEREREGDTRLLSLNACFTRSKQLSVIECPRRMSCDALAYLPQYVIR